jgi:hypothetical protein
MLIVLLAGKENKERKARTKTKENLFEFNS